MGENDEGLRDSQMMSEFLQVEHWMDDHPDFVHDYFVRKAKRNMVDAWLLNHAFSQSPGNSQSQSQSDTSASNSGNNTPVRKISAQEFERGGHILRPLVSKIDGIPTFLSPTSDKAGPASVVPSRLKDVSELKSLDERELMHELVMDICNDLDVTRLCHKILCNLNLLVKADRCSLFLAEFDKGSGNKVMVSKLFDVTSEAQLKDCTTKLEEEIRISWGQGIIGHVAQSGTLLNIPDAYADPRFNQDVDSKTGYRTRSILSCPIIDQDGTVLGVAQAINKVCPEEEPFDEQDEKVFSSYLSFCAIGIKNARLYECSELENRRGQLLLDLARVIFEEQSNLSQLIHKIMVHTQSLLRCERCQVLLIDETFKGVFSQVFDLQASDFDNDDSYQRKGSAEPRFPINIGITGYVAATGENLNIPDAYAHEKFDPSVDQNGFRTKSILCMPIKNAQNNVLGVCQFVNKLDGSPFNINDEHLFEAFAIFCGLGIHNTRMYEKSARALAKQRVALDVLSYHATATNDDVQKLKYKIDENGQSQRQPIPSIKSFHLYDHRFNDFPLDDDDTLRATIRMFTELDLIEKFHINYEVLCRFLLSVKKNYRNVTYHNWRHAFNVAQTMFWMITQGHMNRILSDLENLALLVGCLCHDLDHRGTNNQFQIKTMSPLAQLYSTSVMEHHHFDQSVMIINTKGNEIFLNLTQEQYEQAIKFLEHAILATDLALYFKYRGEFFGIVETGKIDWEQERHRDLLRSMMMTACDVSAITKPWEVQRKVAVLVASEFFEQGDIEKKELKITPMDMMDRDKEDQLPTMQVGFIDAVCLPVYQALSKVNVKLKPLQDGVDNNRMNWQRLAEQRSKRNADEQSKKKENKNEENNQQ